MTKSKTTKARHAQKQSSRRFLYGVIAFVIAILALRSLEETFSKDLDYTEE